MMDRYKTLRAGTKLRIRLNGPTLNTTVRDAIPLFEDTAHRAVIGSAIKSLDNQRIADLKNNPGIITPACTGISFEWLDIPVTIDIIK